MGGWTIFVAILVLALLIGIIVAASAGVDHDDHRRRRHRSPHSPDDDTHSGPTGAHGHHGPTGGAGATGLAGIDTTTGATGDLGATGDAGATGATGLEGAEGVTGAAGGLGPTGQPGQQGTAGTTVGAGANGPPGAAGPSFPDNVSGTFVTLGAQPTVSVAAGQPFTYSTAVVPPVSGITFATAVQGPFSASGTVFTLTSIGRYRVTFQTVYPSDGGVVLYAATTLSGLVPLPYTMVGKNLISGLPNASIYGSVEILTTTASSFLACCAAAGNVASIVVPEFVDSTNISATTITIEYVSAS